MAKPSKRAPQKQREHRGRPLIQRNNVTKCAITSEVGRKEYALEIEKLEVSAKNPSQDAPLGEELPERIRVEVVLIRNHL
jgi:hypothetical protein